MNLYVAHTIGMVYSVVSARMVSTPLLIPSCVKCTNVKSNWWKFVLAAFLPLTMFYFIVLLFKINVTSSNLHGFVYYSQCIAIPAQMRIILTNEGPTRIIARWLGVAYGIWNLRFLSCIKYWHLFV